MRLSLLSFAMINALASMNTIADERQDHKSQNIEKITVWGTTVKSTSIYLGNEDIANKQADHLSDLLRSIPGVEVGGTHSLNQRINIRGFSDTSLQITLDGAIQNANMYHHVGNLLINPNILKSVDLQVGSNSVVYGGLNGTVEFETKDVADLLMGDEKFGGRVEANYQSNAAVAGSIIGYSQLTDNIDFLGYFNYANRDNIDDGDGHKAIGNDGASHNLMAKLGYDFNEQNRIKLTYDSYKDDGDYNPRPDLGALGNQSISATKTQPTQYLRDTFTLSYELNLGNNLNLRATAFNSKTELSRDNEATRVRPPQVSTIYSRTGENINSGLRVRARSEFSGDNLQQRITYGFEYNKTQTEQITTLNNNVVNEQSSLVGFYIEDRIEFGALAVTPGLRKNNYQRDFDSGINRDWDELVTALGIEVQVNNNVTVTANSTGLFEAPPMGEIFSGAGESIVVKDGLEPATGRNNEVGIKFSSQEMFDDNILSVSVKRFQTQIENYFETVSDRKTGVSTIGNIKDEITLDGWEASILYQQSNLETLITYSATDSDTALGEPNREFGHRFGLGFKYYLEKYNVVLNWNSLFVLDEKDNISEPLNNKQGYNVHNMSMNWRPQTLEQLEVTFGVDNLLDKLYVSHASRTGAFDHPVFGHVVLNDYEAGRNIKLSLAYNF